MSTKPIAVWLGSTAPARSVRWIDGVLEAAAALGAGTAIAAGDQTWHYLAADRARRVGLAAVGIKTDLRLDYLGWSHVVAAMVKELGATTILVDEASRPERFGEVAAIAELLDRAQLTSVISLSAIAGDPGELEAKRVVGTQLQRVRVRGPAVIGCRIPGPQIDEYPTPTPSSAMRKLELADLKIEAGVIARHTLPPRAAREPRKTIERVAEYLALHAAPKTRGAD